MTARTRVLVLEMGRERSRAIAAGRYASRFSPIATASRSSEWMDRYVHGLLAYHANRTERNVP